MKVLLACERSGGHIFPAIAFGQKIRQNALKQGRVKDSKIYFFLTSSRLREYVKKEGFETIGVSLNSRNLLVESVWRCLEAIYIIIKVRPARIIGFGGRDSFFLTILGSFLPIKTIIYEPNLVLGKANRLLSYFSRLILRGFVPVNRRKKEKVIGIPLRKNIKKIDKNQACKMLNFDAKPVVLCLGGSQGSEFINQTFLRFVAESKLDYQLIHLSGYKSFPGISQYYRKVKKNKFVKDFYYDMEVLYSAADIVISRAGAITLGEISFYGLASLLIPHPQGGGHQEKNAVYFERRKAAYVFRQNSFFYPDFFRTLNNLIEDDNLRREISNNSRQLKLGVSFEEFSQIDDL